MFFHITLLSRQHRSALYYPWLAATRGVSHVKHKDLHNIKIGYVCDQILSFVTSNSGDPRKRFSLRLSLILIHGVCRILNRQAEDLLKEGYKLYNLELKRALVLIQQLRTPPEKPKKAKKTQKAEVESSTPQEQEVFDPNAPIAIQEVDFHVTKARVEEITLREDDEVLWGSQGREQQQGGFGDEQELVVPEPVPEKKTPSAQVPMEIVEPPPMVTEVPQIVEPEPVVPAPAEVIELLPLAPPPEEVVQVREPEVPAPAQPKIVPVQEEPIAAAEPTAVAQKTDKSTVRKKEAERQEARRREAKEKEKVMAKFERALVVRYGKRLPETIKKARPIDWEEPNIEFALAKPRCDRTKLFTPLGLKDKAEFEQRLEAQQAIDMEVPQLPSDRRSKTPSIQSISVQEEAPDIFVTPSTKEPTRPSIESAEKPPSETEFLGPPPVPVPRRKRKVVSIEEIQPFKEQISDQELTIQEQHVVQQVLIHIEEIIATVPEPVVPEPEVVKTVRDPVVPESKTTIRERTALESEERIRERTAMEWEERKRERIAIEWEEKIIEVIRNWDFAEKELTPVYICQKLNESLNKLNMARIFTQLLMLFKKERVMLQPDDDSTELRCVLVGPRF